MGTRAAVFLIAYGLLYGGPDISRLAETDCATSLPSTYFNAPPEGGSYSISVVSAGCIWTATTTDTWIRFTSSPTGGGAGTVLVTVDPSQEYFPRTGEIRIGTSTVFIRQAATVCSSSLTPPFPVLPASGGNGIFAVTLTPSYCTWTPRALAPWLSITPVTIVGSGTISYSYTENATPLARKGLLAAGLFGFEITQAAAVCTHTLTNRTLGVPPSGGLYVAPVLASFPACDSTAWTAADWIRLEVIGSQVNLHVTTNPGASVRSATVTINGEPFLVNQATSGPCPIVAAPLNVGSIGADGTNGKPLTQLVTAGAACRWTAIPFSQGAIVQPYNAVGTNVLSWSVYPNFGTRARTIRVMVAGSPVTLTQAGSAESDARRFIRLVYFSFLGRLPSTHEMDAQVANVYLLGRAGFADSVMNSFEFNSTSRFIAGLYAGLLNRDAEYSGYQFQREALRLGIANVPGLVTNFLNSPEYKLRNGTLTDDAFIRSLYGTVLLREPSDAEVAGQVANLRGTDRSSMANWFLQSPEFYQGNGSRLTAFLLYATLLLRDPGGLEKVAVAEKLLNRVSRDALIDEILKTAEFSALLE